MSWRCNVYKREEDKMNSRRYEPEEKGTGKDESKAQPDKGEVMAFMKDIEEESKSMMQDLAQIDDMLVSLAERLEEDRADKREILRTIESVRVRIGVMEKEDRIEMNEEEVAESLLSKLKKWVEQVV
jgi:hypothetical protein